MKKSDLEIGMELIKKYCIGSNCRSCKMYSKEMYKCNFRKNIIPEIWKIPVSKSPQQIKIEELEKTINEAQKQIEELKVSCE